MLTVRYRNLTYRWLLCSASGWGARTCTSTCRTWSVRSLRIDRRIERRRLANSVFVFRLCSDHLCLCGVLLRGRSLPLRAVLLCELVPRCPRWLRGARPQPEYAVVLNKGLISFEYENMNGNCCDRCPMAVDPCVCYHIGRGDSRPKSLYFSCFFFSFPARWHSFLRLSLWRCSRHGHGSLRDELPHDEPRPSLPQVYCRVPVPAVARLFLALHPHVQLADDGRHEPQEHWRGAQLVPAHLLLVTRTLKGSDEMRLRVGWDADHCRSLWIHKSIVFCHFLPSFYCFFSFTVIFYYLFPPFLSFPPSSSSSSLSDPIWIFTHHSRCFSSCAPSTSSSSSPSTCSTLPPARSFPASKWAPSPSSCSSRRRSWSSSRCWASSSSRTHQRCSSPEVHMV